MRASRARAKKTEAALAMAKVLREQRERRMLTQEAFAELVGLSKNYIGNLERGEYEVSLSTLTHIGKKIGLKASELLRKAGL